MDTYSTQEVIGSKFYQNMSNEQKAMFIQTFGNRSDLTPEMLTQFAQSTSGSGGKSGKVGAGLATTALTGGALLASQLGKTAKDTAKTEATKQGLEAILETNATQEAGTEIAKQGANKLAQTAAENEAYNQAATQAGTSSLGQIASNFGGMGIGPQTGIIGGTALTLKGLNDLRKGRTDNSTIGKASRLQTGISTFGFSEIARALGMFKPKTEVEDKKLEDLKKRGLLPKDYQINRESRSREQQLADINAGKGTGNKAWLASGDEKDLTAQDIQGYAGLIQKEQDAGKRLKLAQQYVDELKKGNKLFDEHHGTIDFKDLPNQPTQNQLIKPVIQANTTQPISQQQPQANNSVEAERERLKQILKGAKK